MAFPLGDVRKKYPEYKGLSDKALANALYARFYSDMPRAKFEKAVQVADQSLGDQLSAGFTSGVRAVPIVGPGALNGLEQLKGLVQGRDAADVATSDAQQVQLNPTASTIGGVAGTVAPFLLAGEIPAAARLLGIDSAASFSLPTLAAGTGLQLAASEVDRMAR